LVKKVAGAAADDHPTFHTSKGKQFPMLRGNIHDAVETKELVTELAEATYRVARRNDYRGALIDVELDLWQLHKSLPRPREASKEER
jgi:hypothetical protein